MRFLRTVSTRRLLALIAGVVIAGVAGTAIAIAAVGSGPVPKAESLADAIHQGLSAPKVDGITADISFTDHLIDSSELTGSTDPLLNGATGRLWYDPAGHRLRLELQSTNGDSEIVVDGTSFWISDPAGHAVYEGTLPAMTRDHASARAHTTSTSVPGLGQIQDELGRLAKSLDISAAVPTDVAGQPAYSVRVSPKTNGGLVGSAEIAWDALRGIPLQIAIDSTTSQTPVLELTANDISYGPVPASDFAISPPAGDHVTRIAAPQHAADSSDHHARPVTGESAVAATLPFTLAAPDTLAGMARNRVIGLDWGGHRAALVTYGHGLGGIAVIEHAAGTRANASAQGGGEHGLSLPSVTVDGVSGQELQTALGSAVSFTDHGVAATVLGSVTPDVARQAAAGIARSM